jgi:hypothetical protein
MITPIVPPVLKVPPVQQIGPDANEHNSDCAIIALSLLWAYKLAQGMTPNAFYNFINPVGDGGLDEGAVEAEVERLGLPVTWKVGLSMGDVFNYLSANRPMMALIHYGPLVTAKLTQFSDFTGGHFVAVVGIDTYNVYIIDPYHSDGLGQIAVPLDVWHEAWGLAHLDGGNPDFGAMICDLPIQDLSKPAPQYPQYMVSVTGGSTANVRNGPLDSSAILGYIANGQVVSVDMVDSFHGRSHFLARSGFPAGGWIWSAYLVKVV